MTTEIEAHRRQFRMIVDELVSAGRGPVVLYGAGKLTAELQPLTVAPWGTLVGVVDDDPSRKESTWAGLPLLRSGAVAATGARSVIVTSLVPGAQKAMADRAAGLAEQGLAVAFYPDMGLRRMGFDGRGSGLGGLGASPSAGARSAMSPPAVSLNLGGGWAWREAGWLNLEDSLKYNFGEVGLRGFPDGCAERIYTSHALEHIQLEAARRVLTDCRRVLKPGGVLRIVVPDCELFVRAWREKNEAFLTGNPALAANFKSLRECAVEMGGNRAGFDSPSRIGHHFFYDRWSLTWLLLLCGFERVEESSFGRSLDPVMAKPVEMDENGQLIGGFDSPSYRPISVYVDAVA